MEPPQIEKIISGGQTGVDRAALDVALELEIPCGGWCPKGRKAEDGAIPDKYPLEETKSASYTVRTEKNVRDSDGTLIFTWGLPKGGTARTLMLAQKFNKPFLLIDLSRGKDPSTARKWEQENRIKILNVAGPRESEVPGIHGRTKKFLQEFLREE